MYQAGCEIRPLVSPQVVLQSTWLKAGQFKRALQFIIRSILLLFCIELRHRIEKNHLTPTFTLSHGGSRHDSPMGHIAMPSLSSQWGLKKGFGMMLSLSLNDRTHCRFSVLHTAQFYDLIRYPNPLPSESARKYWRVWTSRAPWATNAHKPGPHRWTTLHREGKAAQKHPWRNMQLARLCFQRWAGRMTCELHFAGDFSHLHGRSQIHSGLHILEAYWKPTGGWFCVLRINCVICKDSKGIFSFQQEPNAELWTVGDGNSLLLTNLSLQRSHMWIKGSLDGKIGFPSRKQK